MHFGTSRETRNPVRGEFRPPMEPMSPETARDDLEQRPDGLRTFLPSLFAALGARPTGLASAEATARPRQFGPNTLRVSHKRTFARLLISRVCSPLVILLLAASSFRVRHTSVCRSP